MLSLKGPALFKQEEESHRRDVWSYSGDKLVFREGRLEKWGSQRLEAEASSRPAERDAQPAVHISTVARLPLIHGRNQPRSVPLTEILRDVPSEEEEKGHAASSPGMPMPAGPRGIIPLEAGRTNKKNES